MNTDILSLLQQQKTKMRRIGRIHSVRCLSHRQPWVSTSVLQGWSACHVQLEDVCSTTGIFNYFLKSFCVWVQNTLLSFYSFIVSISAFLKLHWTTTTKKTPYFSSKRLQTFKNNILEIPDISSPGYTSLISSYGNRSSSSSNMPALWIYSGWGMYGKQMTNKRVFWGEMR